MFVLGFFTGCLGYTVYCEIGGEVCLDFVKNNSLNTFAIKKDSLLVCISFDGNSTIILQSFDGNCSISPTKMSMCLGNFMSEDAGIFSLHNGLTISSVLLNSISLVKAGK